jgi:glutamate dehydrogenase
LRALSQAVLSDSAADPIGAWKARNGVLYERFRQVLADLRATEPPDLAMLSVAMRELRNLTAQ